MKQFKPIVAAVLALATLSAALPAAARVIPDSTGIQALHGTKPAPPPVPKPKEEDPTTWTGTECNNNTSIDCGSPSVNVDGNVDGGFAVGQGSNGFGTTDGYGNNHGSESANTGTDGSSSSSTGGDGGTSAGADGGTSAGDDY